ncbi:MAG TPA: serine/threonine protein kinase [Dehalococcoidia bacterium]|nr:serine/threonine protein kinase [Dehalococcoidia bacterium]
MTHPLIDLDRIEVPPDIYIAEVGKVFARFDEHTQDSDNRSYSVAIGDERYVVKTAGPPDDTRWYLDHTGRVALLRNAVEPAASCEHAALPRLHNVIETPHGPALVYEWLAGDLLGVRAAQRDEPASPFQRFRALPVEAVVDALDVVYDLHRELAGLGWVSGDLYDSTLIYDFDRRVVRVMDLDSYHRGPVTNAMGRMFGSQRFMAPEEFELGALIDEQTTVFTLGRTAAVLLSDGTLDRAPFRGSDAQHAVVARAGEEARGERHATVGEFVDAWEAARA